MPRSHQRAAQDSERDAEQVLARRKAVDARGLIALIREINPSGRNLSKRDEERRYALKSRLQSLLIERHRDELSLEQDTSDANVVLLRHRYLDEHACHASIDSMEPDARAWVRLRLDLGDGAPAQLPPSTPKQRRQRRPVSGDPVAQGDHFLAEFEFDLAREAYLGGLEHPDHGVRAARALLSMLVDQLAADAEALALEAELPELALADSSVVELLALAAARGGQPERARRLLHALETPRAAEALVLLAHAAIEDADLSEAELLLTRARERDPLFPELASVSESLQQARAAEHKPLEDEAAATLERGDRDEAERLARRILESWPDSAAAGRIIRRVEDARREERIRALLEEAEAATREERFEEAALRLRAAAAHGAAGLEQRISAADAQAKKAREEAELARASRLLDGEDREASLMELLAVPQVVRDEVLRVRPDPAARWAATLGAAGVPALAAVRAALALLDAVEGDRSADAQSEALEPHRSALERLAEGRAKLEELKALRAESLRRTTEALLREAEARFEAGELDAAQRAFNSIVIEQVASERRASAEALRERIAESIRQRDAVLEVDRLEAKGDFLGALEVLRSLRSAELDLAFRQSALQVRVRAAWRVQVERIEVELEIGQLGEQWIDFDDKTPGWWLSPDGLLYMTRCEGRWLFVTEAELQTGRVCRQAMLVAPAPLTDADSWVDGDSLWIANGVGILQLERQSFGPLRWKQTRELLEPDERATQVLPVPGSGLVWVTSRAGFEERTTVWETGRWREVRRLHEPLAVKSLVAGDAPSVLVRRAKSTPSLIRARGTPSTALEAGRDWTICAVAPHPEDRGLLVAAAPSDEAHERGKVDDDCSCVLGELEPPHAMRDGALRIEGLFDEKGLSLASARGARRAFLLFDEILNSELRGFRFDGGRLRFESSASVAEDSRLVQDASGQRAALLTKFRGRLHLRELGPDRLDDLEHSTLDRHPPPVQPPFRCAPNHPGQDAAKEMLSIVKSKPVPERESWLAGQRKLAMKNPGQLLQIVIAAGYAKMGPVGQQTLDHAFYEFPTDPWVAVMWAEQKLAGGGEHKEVREVLERLSPDGIPAELKRHHLHLLGVARLATGGFEGAEAAWREGLAHKGSCSLTRCLMLVDVFDAERAREPHEEDEKALWSAGLLAMREADACLERGDAKQALAAMEASGAGRLGDFQLHARLAAAWLQVEPNERFRCFEKALALATFLRLVDEHDPSKPHGSRMLPMRRAWDAERIEALVATARAWLENLTR